MTLINLCSHERLEIFPGMTLVVYSEHNPLASVIKLNGEVTIREIDCEEPNDNDTRE